MESLKNKLINLKDAEIPLQFDELKISIQFVKLPLSGHKDNHRRLRNETKIKTRRLTKRST